MRFTSAVLLTLTGVASGFRAKKATCGAKGVSVQIVNGEDAAECVWKWQVGLVQSESPSLPFCGGMLVSDEWVLTAAHCVKHNQPSFYVTAGDWRPKASSKYRQKIKAGQVFQHHLYNPRNMKNDFALVKLSEPVQLGGCVGTVCLPEEDQVVKPGSKCWITGWGTLQSGGSQPDVLQEAEVEIISGSDCVNNFEYKNSEIDNTSMICAQGRDSDGQIVDACQGDSGGPLVCQEGGSWFIHGATSWGYGCAGATYPGIWARVTAARGWIDAVMSGAPVPSPPAPSCRRRWFCQ